MLSKNIVLTGGFCVMFTYTAMSYAVHHNDALKHEILRAETLKVCNGNECVTLNKGDALPSHFNENAPLGAEYALNKKEVNCLAKQILQEPVRNNDLDRAGVGWGTINRVKHSQYPNTICGVVKQKRGKRYDMSWYGDIKKRHMKPRKVDIELARNILLGKTKNPIGNSRHWCNLLLDNRNAFGCKESRKIENVSFKLKNTPHVFVEVSREGL